MTAISTRQPTVWISWNSGYKRQVKHFSDAHKSKRFYVEQMKLGTKPKVHKENPMSEEVKTEVEPKEAQPAAEASEKPVVETKTEPAEKTTPPPKKKASTVKKKNPAKAKAKKPVAKSKTTKKGPVAKRKSKATKSKAKPKSKTKAKDKKPVTKRNANGLSPSKMATLKALKSGKEMTNAQIAKSTGKTKGNCCRQLTEAGLIKTLDLPDVRGKTFVITAKGKKVQAAK